MKEDMPTLEQLDNELIQASKILDKCANMIRDIPFENRKENITKIGYALAHIFDIQNEIYKLKPELTPEYLLKQSPDPVVNKALTKTYGEAIVDEESGNIEGAIKAFDDFLATTPPIYYRNIAQSEIARLQIKLKEQKEK